MRFELVFVLALSTCAYNPRYITLTHEHKPDEDKAIEIIWECYEEYSGEKHGYRNIPIVEWINSRTIPCSRSGSCYGVYYPDLHLAIVAWDKGTKYSRTSLAHELCHAYFDGSHNTCNNDLPPVETANARLRALGMRRRKRSPIYKVVTQRVSRFLA